MITLNNRPHDNHSHVVWRNRSREGAAQCVDTDERVGERLVNVVAGEIGELQVGPKWDLYAKRRATRAAACDAVVNHERVRVLRVQLPLPHAERVALQTCDQFRIVKKNGGEGRRVRDAYSYTRIRTERRKTPWLPSGSWLMRIKFLFCRSALENGRICPGRMSAEMVSGAAHSDQNAICARSCDSESPKFPMTNISGSFHAPAHTNVYVWSVHSDASALWPVHVTCTCTIRYAIIAFLVYCIR